MQLTQDLHGDQAYVEIDNDNGRVVEVARYLEDMGYDLEGMGFVKTEYERFDGDRLIREGESWVKWYDENGNLVETPSSGTFDQTYWFAKDTAHYPRYDDNGTNDNDKIHDRTERITDKVPDSGKTKPGLEEIRSFPLKWYLVTETRAYCNSAYGGTVGQKFVETTDSEEHGLLAFFKRVGDFFEELWAAATDCIAYDTANHSITVTGPTNIKCSLEDWTDKYGMSFEFMVCMHLGTLSPEFVLDLAGGADQCVGIEEGPDAWDKKRTCVEIQVCKQTGYLKLDYNKNGTFIEDVGSRINLTGNDDPQTIEAENGVSVTIPTEIVKYCKAHQNHPDEVNFPFIARTWSHWYRDVAFMDTNSGELYSYDASSENVRKNLDKSGVESISGCDGFELYYIFTNAMQQVAKPYYIDKEPKIIHLINNKTYHIFKGTYDSRLITEDEVNAMPEGSEERKEFAEGLPYYTDKRKIKFLATIKDGMQLLAQIKTTQAQYNLRDLKEILSYYNFEIEDEEESEYSTASAPDRATLEYEEWMKDWRHRVRGYITVSEGYRIHEATDPSSDLDYSKYITYYPDEIPDRTASTYTLDDRSMTIAARTVGGTGFNEDEAVCSTINGTIVAIDDSSITIKSDNGTVMNISHIATNSDLRVGDTVYIGTQVAKTTDEDINVIVKDRYHNALNAEEIVNVNVLINQYA